MCLRFDDKSFPRIMLHVGKASITGMEFMALDEIFYYRLQFIGDRLMFINFERHYADAKSNPFTFYYYRIVNEFLIARIVVKMYHTCEIYLKNATA